MRKRVRKSFLEVKIRKKININSMIIIFIELRTISNPKMSPLTNLTKCVTKYKSSKQKVVINKKTHHNKIRMILKIIR